MSASDGIWLRAAAAVGLWVAGMNVAMCHTRLVSSQSGHLQCRRDRRQAFLQGCSLGFTSPGMISAPLSFGQMAVLTSKFKTDKKVPWTVAWCTVTDNGGDVTMNTRL